MKKFYSTLFIAMLCMSSSYITAGSLLPDPAHEVMNFRPQFLAPEPLNEPQGQTTQAPQVNITRIAPLTFLLASNMQYGLFIHGTHASSHAPEPSFSDFEDC